MIYKRLRKLFCKMNLSCFCALFTGCMARRKFWASLRYKTCANLSNPDGMTIFLWQYAEALQKIIAVMREIEIEIDSLISH